MNNIKIKIGVLGGSFDPAHKGHLAISKEAKKRFKLKKVIWAITKKNPFKQRARHLLLTELNIVKKLLVQIHLLRLNFMKKLLNQIKL